MCDKKEKVWKQSKGRCICQKIEEQEQCRFFTEGPRTWCIWICPWDGTTCMRGRVNDSKVENE